MRQDSPLICNNWTLLPAFNTRDFLPTRIFATGLIGKVDRETALLKETVESAAQVLSETAATTKDATDAAKQASATRRRIMLGCFPPLLGID